MKDEQKFLYKYRHFDVGNNQWISRLFTHNEMYFPSRDQINDPFDCKFDYSFSASLQEKKKYLHGVLSWREPNWDRHQRRSWISANIHQFNGKDNEFLNTLKQGTENLLSGIGIYSLSRKPDDILMWSHYANSHEGFCVQFLDDDYELFIARAQKVVYSEEYPIVNRIIDDDMTTLEKSLLTKAKRWEYEEEWRIIDHKDGPSIKQFPSHLLKGVIFGCKMSDKYKDSIRGWCSNRAEPVSFYQAREASGVYSLEISDV